MKPIEYPWHTFDELYHILMQKYDSTTRLLQYEHDWQFLLAVILSAQCTDRQVNLVTPQLFAKFTTLETLAYAKPHEVEPYIASIGFYHNKARYLVLCAYDLIHIHNGQVPSDINSLIALAGVGRKTAHAVRYEIFKLPAIIVDTHFSRVINRLGMCENRKPLCVEQCITENIAQKYWSGFSMTANLHGRTLCLARKPLCDACPISMYCQTYKYII